MKKHCLKEVSNPQCPKLITPSKKSKLAVLKQTQTRNVKLNLEIFIYAASIPSGAVSKVHADQGQTVNYFRTISVADRASGILIPSVKRQLIRDDR